ncbi:uncharacterized protein LOC117102790 [Anneissia japonica]|uniref:uncharacterized protein LOC117102790 n=1 Tax=Anneissia japonica TaxID=1529436 RepID=UPI0014258DB7|nr:uncharacterized protein LOC117102790 [Anneissia japonica]
MHLLENFEREKITSDEICALSDAQLENLSVTTIGGRHRLRINCRQTGSILSRFMPARHSPNTKKGKHSKTPWTRKIVCLSDPSTITPKCWQKQQLAEAGLSENNITVHNSINPDEFQEVLYANFPKLRDGGV